MAFLGQEEQIREYQDRFKYLYAAVFICLGLLLTRLIDLQILRGDRMRRYSEDNRIKRVKIAAPRGMIFDRTRKLLIDNHPAFDLEIIPQYLRQSKEAKKILSILARILKISETEIATILERASNQPSFIPVKIKIDLTRDEVAEIETWKIDLPGVQVQEEIKRTNIFGDVAAHLLGYIGEVNTTELPKINKELVKYKLGDNIGKFGLERQMEDVLRGIDGEKLVEVDALGRVKLEKGKGRVLENMAEKLAIPGKNLVLTIDQDLQLAAVKAFGDKIGALVAIDPRNGEVLSMISRPSFDPTEFSRGIPAALWSKLLANENRPLRDKTLQDHYPPGSVFKIVTAIAGLEEGVIDVNTKFHCTGSIRIGKNLLKHCHLKRGHGEMNVVSAISESCDVFFYRVAQKLKSVDDIAKWATHLGLGKRTGVGLAREVPGLVPTEEWKMKRYNDPWNLGETLSVAIGQSFVLTTAVQLSNLYASIANGGTLFHPYIVKRIETNEGRLVEEFKPQILDQARLSPKTYELVKQGLWGVINSPHGTAYPQRLPGMDFVGKTGSVQVIRIAADKIYGRCENMKFKDRHNAMFAGFAPANNPVIAVAVIGEHACHGSYGAAPIARAVIKTYLEKYYPEKFNLKAVESLGKKAPIMPDFSAQATHAEEDITVNEDFGADPAIPQKTPLKTSSIPLVLPSGTAPPLEEDPDEQSSDDDST